MGMIEEARVNLDEGGTEALLRANVQANIAAAESLHDVTELLNALLAKLGQVDAGVMLLANKD